MKTLQRLKVRKFTQQTFWLFFTVKRIHQMKTFSWAVQLYIEHWRMILFGFVYCREQHWVPRHRELTLPIIHMHDTDCESGNETTGVWRSNIKGTGIAYWTNSQTFKAWYICLYPDVRFNAHGHSFTRLCYHTSLKLLLCISPETSSNIVVGSWHLKDGYFEASKTEYIPSSSRCTFFHPHLSHSHFKMKGCYPEWFHFLKKSSQTVSWCLRFVHKCSTALNVCSWPRWAYLGRINLWIQLSLTTCEKMFRYAHILISC